MNYNILLEQSVCFYKGWHTASFFFFFFLMNIYNDLRNNKSI